MKENGTSFYHLYEEMARKKIRMEDLSKTLELPLAQVQEKLTGKQELFLDEAIRIRNTYFPVMDIRYLFAQRMRQMKAGSGPVKMGGGREDDKRTA